MVAAGLDEMQTLLSDQIDNMRRIIHALQPTYLEELGLATALEMLAQEQGATFQLQGEERRLGDAAELALFRIAQEGLRNSVQHASADSRTITLSFADDEVRLHIMDDGQGFIMPDAPTAFAIKRHYGLLNIRERAEAIGAHVVIDSRPGRGTQITVISA